MQTIIIILVLLSSPLLLALLIAKLKNTTINTSKYACWGLGIAFVFFFIGHIVLADGMVEMLPPWLPLRLEIVYLTGVLELGIGLALFIPKLQLQAAKLAIAVFVVFFTANVYSAMNSVGLGGHQSGPAYLLIRTPLQIVLIAWAYYLCIKPLQRSLLKAN